MQTLLFTDQLRRQGASKPLIYHLTAQFKDQWRSLRTHLKCLARPTTYFKDNRDQQSNQLALVNATVIKQKVSLA